MTDARHTRYVTARYHKSSSNSDYAEPISSPRRQKDVESDATRNRNHLLFEMVMANAFGCSSSAMRCDEMGR